MKQLLLIAGATALLFAQQSGSKMAECGLGLHPDHPCHCTKHVDEVQAEHIRNCVLGDESLKTCMGKMPDHCSIVEHYGRWELGEDGEHSNPMPQQCTRACTRGHCRCSDGRTCHFAHQPQEDDGLPPVYPGQEEENQ